VIYSNNKASISEGAIYSHEKMQHPVFYITGGHSGSAQLCEYLQDDAENFTVPMLD